MAQSAQSLPVGNLAIWIQRDVFLGKSDGSWSVQLTWGDKSHRPEFSPVTDWKGRLTAVLQPNPQASSAYGFTSRQAVLEDWGGRDFEDLMTGVDPGDFDGRSRCRQVS